MTILRAAMEKLSEKPGWRRPWLEQNRKKIQVAMDDY
jgi:hypothetical protein